jgi:hypothetical protein
MCNDAPPQYRDGRAAPVIAMIRGCRAEFMKVPVRAEKAIANLAEGVARPFPPRISSVIPPVCNFNQQLSKISLSHPRFAPTGFVRSVEDRPCAVLANRTGGAGGCNEKSHQRDAE